jgi:hypothetical protein
MMDHSVLASQYALSNTSHKKDYHRQVHSYGIANYLLITENLIQFVLSTVMLVSVQLSCIACCHMDRGRMENRCSCPYSCTCSYTCNYIRIATVAPQ